MSAFGDVAPQQRAANEMRNTIRRVAHEVHGAEIVDEPIEGCRFLTTSTLDDPLAGIRAAVLVRDVALGELLKYAEHARGAGRSWDEVGEALGIEATEVGEPRDEQAYLLLVEGRPLPSDEPSSWWSRPTARWICTSCAQRITDHGPFESHPDDVEEGHADYCARRSAARAAHDRDL